MVWPFSYWRKDMKTLSDILNVKEAYQLPNILMQIMLDEEKRGRLLRQIKQCHVDKTKDFIRDEYQKEHGDRERMKQDYTPDCLAELVSKLLPDSPEYADICAGTGTLTISNITNHGKAQVYYGEELSSRAIPFLLCNLAMRNVNAIVVQKDALTCETYACYIVTAGKEFSNIQIDTQHHVGKKYSAIVTNPPYSMKWKPIQHRQFEGYEPLPANAADFAFILHGLDMLADGGTMIAIMPHGVLFREKKEEAIRQKLIDRNLIDAVIGLPEKMFLYTAIPVCLIIFKKNRNTKDIFYIDASKECQKHGKTNVMTPNNIRKIIDVYHNRLEVKRFSALASKMLIQENDYNLNIPRYVDTYIPEPVPDMSELLTDLCTMNRDIRETEQKVLARMEELVGSTKKDDDDIKKETAIYRTYLEKKYEQCDLKEIKCHDEMQSLF